MNIQTGRLVCLAAAACWLACASAQAANRNAPRWKTGASFRTQLTSPTSVAWAGVPLRAALANLARQQRTAIVLDRRIDPGRIVRFAAVDMPLEQMCQRLAVSLGLGVCRVDPIIYFGPPESARKLATLAAVREEENKTLPDDARRRLAKKSPASWKSLAEPRGLLGGLADAYDVRIENPDAVAHDLWPASALPPMNFARRATLLLAGFDLTYQWTEKGKVLKIIAAPTDLKIERSYRLKRGGDQAAKLQAAAPDAHMRENGNQLVVKGRVEDHRIVQRILLGKAKGRPRKVTQSEKRYTLKIENKQLGPTLALLAKSLGRELRIDPTAEEKMSRLFNVDVSNVTVDRLLEAILLPSGLQGQLGEEYLDIKPAAK